MFEAFIVALASVWADSGFSALTSGNVIMIVVGLVLLYMAIGRGFEPLLLSPIAFGCILANIPKNGFEQPGVMSVIMYCIFDGRYGFRLYCTGSICYRYYRRC